MITNTFCPINSRHALSADDAQENYAELGREMQRYEQALLEIRTRLDEASRFATGNLELIIHDISKTIDRALTDTIWARPVHR